MPCSNHLLFTNIPDFCCMNDKLNFRHKEMTSHSGYRLQICENHRLFLYYQDYLGKDLYQIKGRDDSPKLEGGGGKSLI